jgi:gas vesicle protein
MENQGNNGRVLLALLGGVAIGALLGVLLAPNKGSETRKKIVDEAKKAGSKAGDAIKEKIREKMASVNGFDESDMV